MAFCKEEKNLITDGPFFRFYSYSLFSSYSIETLKRGEFPDWMHKHSWGQSLGHMGFHQWIVHFQWDQNQLRCQKDQKREQYYYSRV